jgi:predicted ATP-dependent protease
VATVSPSDLRRTADPASLPFATTAEVEPLEGMTSQPRAEEALGLALEMDAPGYNVFATGPPGTGKRSVLETELRRRAAARPAPPDWVYVHDFADATRPAAIALPSGRGPKLERDIAALIEDVSREVRAAFESDTYREQHRALHERLDRRRVEVLRDLQEEALKRGIAVEPTPAGFMTAPLVAGRPVSRDELMRLAPEHQARYQAGLAELKPHIDDTFARLREAARDAQKQHTQLDREVALAAIGNLVEAVKREWADVERLGAWLDALREDLLDHLDALRTPPDEAPPPVPMFGPALAAARASDLSARYAVNVLTTREPDAGAPVVAVHDCSFYELFGRIEYDTAFGAAVTDHRHLRPGAVHRAAGGYLLLEARDVIAKPFVWGRLKELLRTGRARIENLGTQYMLFPSATLDPEPIDVNLTVVLVGTSELHALLHALDDDVQRLFKLRADFDSTTAWDESGEAAYAAFVSRIVREHGLAHFDSGAVGRLIEHGARLAADRERLSTRYPEIADVLVEAAHEARADGAEVVTAAHVERSLRRRRRRVDLPEQRLREHILDGTLRIDVTGNAVGQINGLAVSQLGEHRFGHPVRVTATVASGDGDVVDIDREAELSGPIHDKGVLILAGLLRHLYCRSTPLALRASLVFEQSYAPVEGDSASGAELFALLSALADVPLTQQIAVTGSIDQHGRIQAIGGVNEKIEGFFALCRESGFTGEQGVAIPASNLRHLMLDREVVEAVEAGKFHVWAISTLDEGIELLTGMQAGAPDEDGNYPEASFHGRTQARIASLAELARGFRVPAQSAADGAAKPTR